MPRPSLSPVQMSKVAAMAAQPDILAQLTESQSNTLQYILKNGAECYQTCQMFSTFPDGGKFARRHYPKHMAFMAAGKYAKERGMVAANRVGKTHTVGFEDAVHLTGLYPEWWQGRVFDEPVEWLVSGLTNESTRKVLTPLLLGRVKQVGGRNYVDGTGMIPASHFVPGSLLFRGGAGRIVSEIDIAYRDSKDEFSTLYIMSNEQGWTAFSGTARHGIHLDEEHDVMVYNECFTRTSTTEGVLMTTFTPLNGITGSVQRLLPEHREQMELEERVFDAQSGSFSGVREDQEGSDEYDFLASAVTDEPIVRQADGLGQWVTNDLYTIRIGWEDRPPHLSAAEMRRQMDGTPTHLLPAKTKGVPAVGKGRVYPIDIDTLKIRPFRLPDHWPRCFALDPGATATACVWGAYDIDVDTWYMYAEYLEGYAPPYLHAQRIKGRGDWIPGLVDPAGITRSLTDGERVVDQYRAGGLNLTLADNSVSAGLQACYDRMTTGRLRIFATMSKFESEFLLYRYNEQAKSSDEKGFGKPVKKNDHLLDAMRYIVMSGSGVAQTRMQATRAQFRKRGGWVGSDGWDRQYGDAVAGY